MDRKRLDGPPEEAQTADTPAAAALRSILPPRHGMGELVPDGWRVVDQSDQRVIFAAREERGNGWSVVKVEERVLPFP